MLEYFPFNKIREKKIRKSKAYAKHTTRSYFSFCMFVRIFFVLFHRHNFFCAYVIWIRTVWIDFKLKNFACMNLTQHLTSNLVSLHGNQNQNIGFETTSCQLINKFVCRKVISRALLYRWENGVPTLSIFEKWCVIQRCSQGLIRTRLRHLALVENVTIFTQSRFWRLTVRRKI